MIALGIETSCDDTSIAIVRDDGCVYSSVISSQVDEHAAFGGVVPEIAARAHLENIDFTFRAAIHKAGISISDIDIVAATCGPGLIGGVIVGANFGKAIAAILEKPFFAINHIEAHALSAKLSYKNIQFPYLLLLISGGHCIICIVKSPIDFEILGTTLDDSVGETFDKVAKMLDLGYPGGPKIQQLATTGRAVYDLPRPLYKKQGCSMSFSGLKTAVSKIVDDNFQEENKANLCASFQKTICDILYQKCEQAIISCQYKIHDFVIGGGVAANIAIRTKLQELANKYSLDFYAPDLRYCTDNAAMIAWNAFEKYNIIGITNDIDFRPIPRWPLSQL